MATITYFMPRTSPVANEALAYCTSCKMDLNHTVVAMKGDRIAKVQCRTCKKEHVYKAPKGITEPGKEGEEDTSASGVRKTSKRTKKKESEPEANPIEMEWEKLMVTHKNTPMKSYNTKGVFDLGDKLNHPTFGEGIVGKLIYPNKLEVIFRHDVKVLIHAGQPR